MDVQAEMRTLRRKVAANEANENERALYADRLEFLGERAGMRMDSGESAQDARANAWGDLDRWLRGVAAAR